MRSDRAAALVGPRQLKDVNSTEYAWQILEALKTWWNNKQWAENHWEKIKAEIDQLRIYDKIPPEKPYGSFKALLQAEIGCSEEEADQENENRRRATDLAIKNENKPLKTVGVAGPGRGNKTDSDTTRFNDKRDNEYLTRRIARDRPDILQRMKAGEFKSVRAAGLEAGIVKPRLSIPNDLEGAARALKRHFSANELAILSGLITGEEK